MARRGTRVTKATTNFTNKARVREEKKKQGGRMRLRKHEISGKR